MPQLREARIRCNLTLKQVGDAAGISESYYCLIENGERVPSVSVAKRIASVLGFPWTDFFKDPK